MHCVSVLGGGLYYSETNRDLETTGIKTIKRSLLITAFMILIYRYTVRFSFDFLSFLITVIHFHALPLSLFLINSNSLIYHITVLEFLFSKLYCYCLFFLWLGKNSSYDDH